MKVPERFIYSDYITDRGRHWSRGSPERSHGRPGNGINIIVDEDLDSEGRTTRDLHFRSATSSQIIDEKSSRYAGPKSIAKHKVRKSGTREHVNDHPLPGKRKRSKRKGVDQKGEGGLSFEGPKPLSEILKRKRSAGVGYYEREDKNLDPKTPMTRKRT